MIDVGAPDFALGVVGAGAMGSGIAQVALTGGMAVMLSDSDAAQLDKARATLFARIDPARRETRADAGAGRASEGGAHAGTRDRRAGAVRRRGRGDRRGPRRQAEALPDA